MWNQLARYGNSAIDKIRRIYNQIPITWLPTRSDKEAKRYLKTEKVRSYLSAYGNIARFLPLIDTYTEETAEIRRMYRIMLRDPYVKAAMFTKVFSVASLDLQVNPASKENIDKDAAEWVQYALDHHLGGTEQLIYNILVHGLIDGFSVGEMVWDEVPRGKYKGRVYVQELKPKDSKFLILEGDSYRNITGVQDLRSANTYHPSNFAIWSHMPLYDSPTGMSDFRSAYRAFWLIDAAWQLRAIAMERYGLPIMVGRYTDPGTQLDLESKLDELRSQSWITLPPEVQVEALNLAGATKESEFQAAINDLREEMAVAITGASLQMLQGQVADGRGSSQVHKNTSELVQWYLRAQIQSVIYNQIVPALVEYNLPGADYPTISLGSVSDTDLEATLRVDTGLQQLGWVHSKEEIQEKYGRRLPKDKGDELQPQQQQGMGMGGFPGMGGDMGGGMPPEGPDDDPNGGGGDTDLASLLATGKFSEEQTRAILKFAERQRKYWRSPERINGKYRYSKTKKRGWLPPNSEHAAEGIKPKSAEEPTRETKPTKPRSATPDDLAQSLAQIADPTGSARISELRKAMGNPANFDQMVEQMARSRQIHLAVDDHAALATPEERKQMVKIGDNYYIEATLANFDSSLQAQDTRKQKDEPQDDRGAGGARGASKPEGRVSPRALKALKKAADQVTPPDTSAQTASKPVENVTQTLKDYLTQRYSASSISEVLDAPLSSSGRRINPATGSTLETTAAHAARQHYWMVRKALDRGESVPPEVLADYPDLQSKQSPPANKPDTKQSPSFHVPSVDWAVKQLNEQMDFNNPDHRAGVDWLLNMNSEQLKRTVEKMGLAPSRHRENNIKALAGLVKQGNSFSVDPLYPIKTMHKTDHWTLHDLKNSFDDLKNYPASYAKDVAKKIGINITGLRKKSDILNAVQEAIDNKNVPTYQQAINAGHQDKPDTRGEGKDIRPTNTMKAYEKAKKQFPNQLLAMRVGDFYEFFGDDALEAAKRYGLVITKRNGYPMAGFPANGYVTKLDSDVAVIDHTGKLTSGGQNPDITKTPKPSKTPQPTKKPDKKQTLDAYRAKRDQVAPVDLDANEDLPAEPEQRKQKPTKPEPQHVANTNDLISRLKDGDARRLDILQHVVNLSSGKDANQYKQLVQEITGKKARTTDEADELLHKHIAKEAGRPELFSEQDVKKKLIADDPANRDFTNAEQLLERAVRWGNKALSALVRRVIERNPTHPEFLQEDRNVMTEIIARVMAPANLLGQYRVRKLAEIAEKNLEKFSDQEVLKFAEPIQPMAPKNALEYFRSLVPAWNLEPNWTDNLRKRAFTMAVTSEQTILDRVRSIIDKSLALGQVDQDQPVVQIQAVLEEAGISPRNSQYSEMLFRTNMMQAYTQGSQQAMRDPKVADLFPVWRYTGIRDGRQGKDHEVHFGKYYPSSVDFDSVRGPRIFNCRCNPSPLSKFKWKRLQQNGARLSV